MDTQDREIFSHAVRGAGYVASGVAIAKFSSVVALFAFAHYLRAEEFGIVTLAFVILGLIAPLKDLGLNQAAVFFRTEQAINYASSFRLLSSVVIFVGIATLAMLFPGWFGGDSGRLVVLVIVSSVLVLAVSFSSETRLSRDLRFRELVVADAIRTSVYATASVVLVLLGQGVFGVAIAYLLSFLFRAAWLQWREPLRFKFTLSRNAGKGLIGYGASVTVSSLSILVISNIDSLVVALVFGPGFLGTYAMAWNWSTLVALQAAFVLHQVLFPTFVHLKGNPAAVRVGTQRAVSLAAMFAFPVSAMLAATPHAFVSGFLGGAWATAAKLIPYFCLYAAIRAVIEPLPAGFLALGRPEVLARIQLGHAALVSTLAISAAYVVGIEGVAISVLVAYAIAAVPILFRSKDVLGLGLRPISAAVAPHFVAGMAIYLTISAALAITSADLSLLFLLAVYIAGLGAFLLVSSALSKGRVLDDIRFVVRSITGRGRESAPGGNVETLSVSEGTFGR